MAERPINLYAAEACANRWAPWSVRRAANAWDCGYARAMAGKKPTERNHAYREGYAAGRTVLANIDQVPS